MRPLDINEIKSASFEVLSALKTVCEENGLRYSLTGGTLIGAIRHKGFIPWDDDIDIMMPRPDYDQLIETAKNNELPFRLLSQEICGEAYGYPFAKACNPNTRLKEKDMQEGDVELGVYVDIFPVDGMGNGYKRAKLRCMLFQFLHGLKITSNWTSYHRSKLRKWYYEPFRYVCYLASKVMGRKYIDKRLERFIRKYSYDDSRYVGRLVGDYGSKEIMSKKYFDSTIPVEFEKGAFSAIEGYDDFLRALYGDYMQMPPPEKQVTHHEFTAYWRNK